MKKRNLKILRNTALTILFIIAIFWFMFALLSGSEQYGGLLKGLLMNSPNALPWLLLLGFIFLTYKSEFVGGIFITLMGLVTIFFFDARESLIIFLVISIPLIILGGSFILFWYLARKIKK